VLDLSKAEQGIQRQGFIEMGWMILAILYAGWKKVGFSEGTLH
jgi:hypothetical protein